MIDKVSIQDCALCGACINACPVDAITLSKPYLDFCYPDIDVNRCIHCNKCEKACPILGEKSKPEDGFPIAFAARSKDDSVRLRSSSGGIFYELASYILAEGGYICGAVFDENFHVRHIVSNTQKDLRRMMGSKYAQSDLGFCYRQIKALLDAGEKVLFTGCPCQTAGLRTFLGRDYPELVMAELICHGIPSDQMLQAYISLREKQYGAKLKSMEFRNKDKGWHRSSVRMDFVNGKTYQEIITEDAYMNGFLRNVTLKSACYQCQFRHFHAGYDLTLGDFWGAEVELPDMDDNKGISAILVNTYKGKSLLDKLSFDMKPFKLKIVTQYNQNLIKSPAPNPIRGKFYQCTEKDGIGKAIHLYLEEKPLHKIKRKGRFLLRCIWYAVRGKEQPQY